MVQRRRRAGDRAHGLDRPLRLLVLDARRGRDDHEGAEEAEPGNRDQDPELLRDLVQRVLQVDGRPPACAVFESGV